LAAGLKGWGYLDETTKEEEEEEKLNYVLDENK